MTRASRRLKAAKHFVRDCSRKEVVECYPLHFEIVNRKP